jgi:multidrug efflux pump subunit AcrA (membrane-fusion protein)
VADNDVLVTSGLKAGQTVVTAGVNLLKAGQKVKLLPAETVAVAPAGVAK